MLVQVVFSLLTAGSASFQIEFVLTAIRKQHDLLLPDSRVLRASDYHFSRDNWNHEYHAHLNGWNIWATKDAAHEKLALECRIELSKAAA